ncbi:MAG TPA: fructose-6-phosphate aldolase [Syntrophomonas sp.]|nr:fructose-6-phosphate aldolase [Syntrophomonas sp.]
MRIFIDSANIEEIKDINTMGFLTGVTTNPSLVAKEKRDYREVIGEICSIVEGPVSAEVIAQDYAGMMQEAEMLAAIHPNVVIKIAMTEDGLRVISALRQKGIKTNATLIFSAAQALLAAQAGASYVSPFLGRIDDTSGDGMILLEDIMTIFNQFILDTEVIAASIRHPVHVLQAARIGSHIATVPYKIIKQMIKHPLTDAGIQRFLQDWQEAFK